MALQAQEATAPRRSRRGVTLLAVTAAAGLALITCRSFVSIAFLPAGGNHVLPRSEASPRRAALLGLGVAAAEGISVSPAVGVNNRRNYDSPDPALAVRAREEPASTNSRFQGTWKDPDSPGCKREILMSFDGRKGRLLGADSLGNKKSRAPKTPGCKEGDQLKSWEKMVTSESKDSDTLVIQMSKGREVVEITATLDKGDLVFPDGTRWTKG
eukprot:TRINITY_DN5499_c0_g2_i1.p1 TRINITY_DN5499_c0_g2~~TRINITY_DN5499_c0_g2_i1.p1  ORF type:complete len:213 (+),score=36.68 TRINITY_DN5499_c0_g2_i1:66-704(+)